MFRPTYLVPETMYQIDYHPWPLKPRHTIIPTPVPEDKGRPLKRPIQMDLEIMQPFKSNANVPFNLLHRKKVILQINAHDPIPNVKFEDKIFELKLQARRERPSVYMVPQINLDDVPENVMYGDKEKPGLVSNIYSSQWKKACEYAMEHSPLKSKHKEVEKFEKKDIINKAYEKIRQTGGRNVPPMEIGLAKYIDEWENQNPKKFVDTTTLFWERNSNKGLCTICDPQPAGRGLNVEQKEELEDCLEMDSLRSPFTIHPPGYTGYVPRLPTGIPFRKKRVTKYDPFVTTLMEAQGVCRPSEK